MLFSSRPSFVSHQKRSRPRRRCGSGSLPRADRKGDRARGRELFRDLETGVSAADDEDATVGYVVGSAVVDAVHLLHVLRQLT